MTNVEDAKAAAEAAVQEHFALRKEQTERIRKAKAGGVKGELSSTHLPPQPQTPPPPPLRHNKLMWWCSSEGGERHGERVGGGGGSLIRQGGGFSCEGG